MEYIQLDVWVETRKLANLIYDVTKNFPKEEIFGLVNQMRRCAVSVPSNIAEGCGRQTAKDTINFLHISPLVGITHVIIPNDSLKRKSSIY